MGFQQYRSWLCNRISTEYSEANAWKTTGQFLTPSLSVYLTSAVGGQLKVDVGFNHFGNQIKRSLSRSFRASEIIGRWNESVLQDFDLFTKEINFPPLILFFFT